MINQELKKDILKIIIFSVILVFSFIYIKPIWLFLMKVLELFMPFIIGIVIAFVLNILVIKIEKSFFSKVKIKEKSKHNLSITMAITFVFIFLTFLGLLIVPQVKNTTNIFIENIDDYQNNVSEILKKVGVNQNIQDTILMKTKEFGDKTVDYLKNNSGEVVKNVVGIATNLVTSLANITIAIIFAIYLLVDKERLLRQLNKLLMAYFPEKRVNKIKKIAISSNKTFASFVSGQFLEAFIIGVLCLIGMIILRIPYAATISVLVGFTALVPVFGAFIGTGLGAFLIFMVNPVKALVFIIFILILQQFEGNLIYPKVVGKSVNLPGIWVLVAVSIGASLSGIIGMLISVPIVSVCYSFLATNVNERLENKGKIRPKKVMKN